MSQQEREVWISHEAYITIWEENGDGTYNVTGGPVRDESYAQGVDIEGRNEVKRRGQPGATTKDADVVPDGFSISLESFYERKDQQLAPFRDSTKKWRVRLYYVNGRYSGTGEFSNDDHVFRDCVVSKWRVVTQDDQITKVSVDFEADRMET